MLPVFALQRAWERNGAYWISRMNCSRKWEKPCVSILISTSTRPDVKKILLMAITLLTFQLTACGGLMQPMTGENLRAALDECKENDLDELSYVRPDSSIMAVRCIPKKDQVAKEVKVWPHIPMKVLRPLLRVDGVEER